MDICHYTLANIDATGGWQKSTELSLSFLFAIFVAIERVFCLEAPFYYVPHLVNHGYSVTIFLCHRSAGWFRTDSGEIVHLAGRVARDN